MLKFKVLVMIILAIVSEVASFPTRTTDQPTVGKEIESEITSFPLGTTGQPSVGKKVLCEVKVQTRVKCHQLTDEDIEAFNIEDHKKEIPKLIQSLKSDIDVAINVINATVQTGDFEDIEPNYDISNNAINGEMEQDELLKTAHRDMVKIACHLHQAENESVLYAGKKHTKHITELIDRFYKFLCEIRRLMLVTGVEIVNKLSIEHTEHFDDGLETHIRNELDLIILNQFSGYLDQLESAIKKKSTSK